MNSGCLGLVGLVFGVSILTGGKAVAPGADTTLVGCIVLGAGVLLMAVNAWESIAGKRQDARAKDAAISQVQRLAALKAEGMLTDEEFTAQKRELLGEGATPPILQIEKLAGLLAQGTLTDTEFASQKREILREESLERLARLRDQEYISEETFECERSRLLGDGNDSLS